MTRIVKGARHGHEGWSPLPWLGAFWGLVVIHLGLELRHAYPWLWLPDAALAALTAMWLWRNWPRGAMPPLLRVLFYAYVWLPTAFALFATQAAWYAATGSFALGRAPAHALFIGFFGSLLVAMVTRVTQGHSGRPLVLGTLAGFAFVAIQLVAVLRMAAEMLPGYPALQAVAAAGWLLAFAPWALRSARVYLSARADGKPG
jgi:uncharacterized protein involved in response to NO